ncbi:glycosyltransferase family 4 protein [Pedobacter sp. SYSU D00535]|uniref:glycosyltransferase family 4 protein n=1 Tax=Pedobacter sp. SYSU D00535 TaxID=2810308 RepID=UPI001A958EB1|nr:glycosyltransferase family 4 protein [Pedobacter sp. SYSU D00535]
MEASGKKILIACDSSRSLLDFRGKLIEALAERNKVYVFTPKIHQEHVRAKLLDSGVGIYENDLHGSNVSIASDLKYIYNLYQVIRSIKPDVFFPYTFKPVIYGALVARLCKINRITPMLTGLGYNFLDLSSRAGLVKMITKKLLKLSLGSSTLRVIFQNRDDYQTLLTSKIIGKSTQAFVVNGSGVDLSHYDYSPPDIRNASFLMISRLINAKGIREYYEAAKAIKMKYPGAEFKLVGSYDDNIDSISRELYDQIKNDGTINYLGEIDDVRPEIRASSVVVLPSYYGEGIPRCMLEAMAMGRPIITSNSVGCKETVNPDDSKQNGFLVPVKNVSALKDHMEYFINNRHDILIFGLNSRSYAEDRFDVHKVNNQMLAILEE